jgi:MYXO-CTERM domain-containing protein
VAGALALLKGRFPELSGEQLQDLLLSSADKDALVPGLLDPTGDDAWGAGRLNVYRALYGEPPPQGNQPPQAALVVYEQEGQVTLDAADSADPEGELLWYRFDLDYDGVWDTPWSQEAVEVLPFEVDPGQTYTARVQVVDGFGASAGALFKWPDPSVTPPEPGEDMGGADMGADLGGADMGGDDMGGQADGGKTDQEDGFVGGGGREVSSCASAAPASSGRRGPLGALLFVALGFWLRRRSA